MPYTLAAFRELECPEQSVNNLKIMAKDVFAGSEHKLKDHIISYNFDNGAIL